MMSSAYNIIYNFEFGLHRATTSSIYIANKNGDSRQTQFETQ